MTPLWIVGWSTIDIWRCWKFSRQLFRNNSAIVFTGKVKTLHPQYSLTEGVPRVARQCSVFELRMKSVWRRATYSHMINGASRTNIRRTITGIQQQQRRRPKRRPSRRVSGWSMQRGWSVNTVVSWYGASSYWSNINTGRAAILWWLSTEVCTI